MLDLFFTFLKIGLFTFGGGYAMIPVIEDICVEQKKWITHDDMLQVAVIAESTPGPIAINCATYVGYSRGGFPGALVATTGVVIPSFAVIYIISMFLDNFLENAVIANAFKGIKIAVGLLILNAGLGMLRKMKKSALSLSIAVCATVAMLAVNYFCLNFSTVSLMLMAGFVSLLVFVLQKKGGGA